ncbi:FHA domain-containing protein [Lysobacter arvi]|uniref:FHA domain-containing protein n=1 Tax=Lysobacter arvi TaxID=3038776 RepID=A0ABU1CEC7_9GAMM|nr:FHA domain-containing protein [Lysobacter arvi]MDR0183197.1 FHA domain-containing protein [Lysobacter arvi]
MKLVFPGGEHPQVLLGHGVNRVGSDPESTIVIDRPGVLPQHCQLHVTAQGVMLDVPAGTVVSVNGRQVQGLIALRPGDSVGFDQVQAKLAALGPPPVVARQSVPGPDLMSANDDPGVTAVRPVLPRFFLRSISAELGNRSDALVGVLTVGRGPDCNLRFDAPGLSRAHARLIPTDTGVQIEDLGSSNGTFLNGKRILRGEAKVGDELAFDVLRFRVAGTAAQEPVQVVPTSMRNAKEKPRRAAWPWVALVVVLAGAGGAVLLLMP